MGILAKMIAIRRDEGRDVETWNRRDSSRRAAAGSSGRAAIGSGQGGEGPEEEKCVVQRRRPRKANAEPRLNRKDWRSLSLPRNNNIMARGCRQAAASPPFCTIWIGTRAVGGLRDQRLEVEKLQSRESQRESSDGFLEGTKEKTFFASRSARGRSLSRRQWRRHKAALASPLGW